MVKPHVMFTSRPVAQFCDRSRRLSQGVLVAIIIVYSSQMTRQGDTNVVLASRCGGPYILVLT